MARITSRKIIKIIGYAAFSWIIFMLCLVIFFPVDRFIPIAEQQLASILGRDVKINDVALSPLGNITLSDVKIEIPPLEEEEENAPVAAASENNEGKKSNKTEYYSFSEISVDVGILGLLAGKLEFDASMDAFGGTLDVRYSGGFKSRNTDELEEEDPSVRARKKRRAKRTAKARRRANQSAGESEDDQESSKDKDDEDDEPVALSINVAAKGLRLKQIREIQNMLPVPVPISGTIDFSLNLDSPTGDYVDSSGHMAFAAKNLIISKKGFKLEALPANIKDLCSDEELFLSPLVIDSTSFEFEFEKGVGEIVESLMKSEHFDLELQGSMNLKDPLSSSRFDLYVKFKPLDGYLKQNGLIRSILSLASTKRTTLYRKLGSGLRSDGYYGYRIYGKANSLKKDPNKNYVPRITRKKKSKAKSKAKTKTKAKAKPKRKRPRPTPPRGGSAGEALKEAPKAHSVSIQKEPPMLDMKSPSAIKTVGAAPTKSPEPETVEDPEDVSDEAEEPSVDENIISTGETEDEADDEQKADTSADGEQEDE